MPEASSEPPELLSIPMPLYPKYTSPELREQHIGWHALSGAKGVSTRPRPSLRSGRATLILVPLLRGDVLRAGHLLTAAFEMDVFAFLAIAVGGHLDFH